ncbi:Protein TRANSPARENT TESTA 12 [Zea mays]|uniref:Protein TRANSPARENT TESTA 12 n=1 Tax=Zea mays TaxID=4577 RepID=A0A1D6N650_MAIZE|nr:Protein TRANSPARENT TESTA 12 [Zea mays]
MAWLGLQLRVLVVRDPCAVCRADARLSSQHFHHCNVPKHRSHIIHDHLWLRRCHQHKGVQRAGSPEHRQRQEGAHCVAGAVPDAGGGVPAAPGPRPRPLGAPLHHQRGRGQRLRLHDAAAHRLRRAGLHAGVLCGVARGYGWQHLAAWTNLVAFYVIGLPLAILLGFTLAFQTKGLWMGQICSLLCQNCVLFFITLRTNWQELDLTIFNKDNDFVC